MTKAPFEQPSFQADIAPSPELTIAGGWQLPQPTSLLDKFSVLLLLLQAAGVHKPLPVKSRTSGTLTATCNIWNILTMSTGIACH
jgi:hypothetical protein